MTRRIQAAEQEFGSDSFLDIIANIVGILIILIVVAGVRVAQQPVTADNTSPVADIEIIDQVSSADDEAEQQRVAEAARIQADRESAEQQVVQLQDTVGSRQQQLQELNSQIASAEREVDVTEDLLVGANQQLVEQQDNFDKSRIHSNRIRQLTLKTEEDTSKAQQQLLQLSQQTDALHGDLNSIDEELARSVRHQKSISDRLQQIGLQTRQLKEVLDENKPEAPADQVIHHRLSPVSKPATDDELHFRLAGGRISHIPLQQLLERLKDQVSARRSTIMKIAQYEGVAGPVGGFTLKYTVTRSELSPLQALQMGASGGYRIGVSRWVLQPADTLEAERVEDALVIGSRFRQILETAAPDTTITVWLYPGGFEHFARIRELAHGLHLRVAARPLPEGMPIVGSPNGSQSNGQ